MWCVRPSQLQHDPPFSRLDIATCRNLLIHQEPELQLRVISLLHFGPREGNPDAWRERIRRDDGG